MKKNSFYFECSSINNIEQIAIILFATGLAKNIEFAKKLAIKEITRGDNYIIIFEEKTHNPAGLVSWKIEGELRHEVIELYHIGVLPQYQGKNFASLLFKKMIEDAKKYFLENDFNLRKIFLKTHATNKVAQEFYKKMGMQHEATLKNHFKKGIDEYIFSLFL